MPSKPKRIAEKSPAKKTNRSIDDEVESAIVWLKAHATDHTLDGMARYAIPSDNAFGVAVGDIRALGKQLGRNHELALALWETGVYEARMLTAFVAEPARITSAEMDRWCRDFDSWGICDALCFHLFDRTPHAWAKIEKWAGRKEEFVKRAAFALLASLALHDKRAPDAPFLESLPLIERAASDERNFVKKGVSWALRGIGRRNPALNAAAVNLARRLAASPEAAARWVGKDALRDLTSPAMVKRLAARRGVPRR
jgi:3-methyladenine DNA glycosylase AlkD